MRKSLQLLSLFLVFHFFFIPITKANNPPVTNNLSPANGVLTNYVINGVTRKFIIYKPTNLPINAPLLFALHGYTQNATMFYSVGFNSIADTAKFMICYAQGLSDTWDIRHNSADIVFIKSLANDLKVAHSINTNAIFATGFSKGGAICNLLAIDAGNIFKAVAPVAGFFDQNVWDSTTSSQFKVPYFAIHGTNDSVIPMNGSKGISGWLGGPTTQTVINYYKTQDECTSTKTVQFNTNTVAYYSSDSSMSKEVWYYKINGQEHAWPNPGNPAINLNGYFADIAGFNACSEIWKFFRKYVYGTTLPINLKNFYAIGNPKNIQLKWEIDNVPEKVHFVIQKSNEGVLFNDIETISSSEKGKNNFHFIDENPHNGINYYRLKIIEKGGNISFSKILNQAWNPTYKESPSISIYPNPIKDFANIQFNKIVKTVDIEIADISGKIISKETLKGNSNTYRLNTQKLSNGLFIIKIHSDLGNYCDKLIINK